MSILATATAAGALWFFVPIVVAVILTPILGRRGRIPSLWLLFGFVSIVPAVWAAAVGFAITDCPIGSCVPHGQATLLKVAGPAVLLLAVGLLLLDRLRSRTPGMAVIVVGQLLLVIALWRTNEAGSIFVVFLMLTELGVEGIRAMRARSRSGLRAAVDGGP